MIKTHEGSAETPLLMFKPLGGSSNGVILHSGARCGDGGKINSPSLLCLSTQYKKACEATLERHIVLIVLHRGRSASER